jgi:hypothetical protein
MMAFLSFVLLTTASLGCFGATITIRSWWSRLVALYLGILCLVLVAASGWFLADAYVHGFGTHWHLGILIVSASFGVASLVHSMTRVDPQGHSIERRRKGCHGQ